MKTRPLAVEMLPPKLNAPVLRPWSPNDGVVPSGSRHAIFPVFTFTAISSPHGGCQHGIPLNMNDGPNLPSPLPPRPRAGVSSGDASLAVALTSAAEAPSVGCGTCSDPLFETLRNSKPSLGSNEG